MDEQTHPLESNLGWTLAWKPESRNFIGRKRLTALRAEGSKRKLTGIVLQSRAVLRHGQEVFTEAGSGEVTSGIFSPTLGYSIGLARVPTGVQSTCAVEIRGKRLEARIVKPPFIRKGRKVFN